jgi:hypothetical protein
MRNLNISEWGLLLNSIVAVLVVVYGIWFRNIVKLQLDAKDSAISALKAAMESKDAEISRLGGEAAPAIATAYKNVKDFAEDIAKNNIELKGIVAAQAQKTPALERAKYRIEGFQIALNIIHGRLVDASAMSKADAGRSVMTTLMDLIGADISKASNQLVVEINAAGKEAKV